MVTLSRRARDLVAAYRRRAPHIEWCVLVAWSGSEADNFRSPDGAQIWVRSIPRGWAAGVCPLVEHLTEEYRFTEVDGVKIGIQLRPNAAGPFVGGVIDAEGSNLCVVP